MESNGGGGDIDIDDGTRNNKCYQVVIIGAGVAGLSAVRHLLKCGIENFVILEATEKGGGRIATANLGGGIVEVGAQWIHGEQNEFCQLVKASNHRHDKTSWEGKGDFLCPTGIKIENGMVDEVLGWVEDTIEEVEATFSIETLEEGKEINGAKKDTSMGEYLMQNFQSYLNDIANEENEEAEEGVTPGDGEMQMALFQWEMSFQRIDNSCNRMNDVSLYRWSEFQVNPGEHYNNFREGAQSFVDNVLVGGIRDDLIQYNSPVENISWNGKSGGPVEIVTRNGTKYIAESVLVTCSIGVLKSNLESLFTPNLPEKHAKAIKSTGFGPVTKIFLEWESPWWPQDFKGFQLVWPKEFIDCCSGSHGQGEEWMNLEENWHKTITGFDPVLDNPHVLLGWLGGLEAVYAEGLPKERVISKCVQILKDFTGQDVPEPKDVLVSKWNTNEFFQGAYSFRSIDGDKIPGDICAALCEPISVMDADGEEKPVIVFAGEALSKTHYSTLHGAYESGMAQAHKLVQYFNTSSSRHINDKICGRDNEDITNEDDAKLVNTTTSQNRLRKTSQSSSKNENNHLSQEIFRKLANVSVNDIQVPS